MIWSQIRVWLYSALGLLVAGLGIAVKVLSSRNSRLRRKVETAEARVEHSKAVIRADKQADEQADVRLVEAKREIEDEGTSSELSDPNKW